MTSKRTAIVLGGSGSVGMALLRELFQDDGFEVVITLSRRTLPEAVALARASGRRLLEKLVPEMTPALLAAATLEAAKDVEGDLEGFSVLGVGAGTAKLTLDEHRAVDVALNEAFARALRDSGKVRHFAFMTAVGADPNAKASGGGAAGMSRYNRVKGEAEEAVRGAGPSIVSVFRPAMIIGSQHTPWLLEKALPLFSFVTPGKFKSITVAQIAKAMVATAKHHPAASATYHYPEMMALITSC
ncbi:MAG TPA: hypothetical protein VFQ61_32675 [Polyangiaceae bacterium]|nr:hypothetical protein [Polyangiaceae bacterium]